MTRTATTEPLGHPGGSVAFLAGGDRYSTGRCSCETVDIGVGHQRVEPYEECPHPDHRAEAFHYFYGFNGDLLTWLTWGSIP